MGDNDEDFNNNKDGAADGGADCDNNGDYPFYYIMEGKEG